MAKRFTSTEKWSDPWYRTLSPRLKCLWDWMFTQCDIAGSIDPDWGLASFQIGEDCGESDIQKFGDRVMRLRCGRLWLKKFIEFQYGELTTTCRAHLPVIAICDRLSIPYTYPTDRDKEQEQEQEKEQDKDKDQDKEGEVGEKTWRTDYQTYHDQANAAFDKFHDDPEWISGQKYFFPGVNIRATIEKAWDHFWGTQAGWQHKKRSRCKEIDWERTILNALDNRSNRVYFPKGEKDIELDWIIQERRSRENQSSTESGPKS